MSTTDCPRVMTKDEMITGLKAGQKLAVDRRDAPELPELLEMEREGLVESRLEVISDQYSRRLFWWVGPK